MTNIGAAVGWIIQEFGEGEDESRKIGLLDECRKRNPCPREEMGWPAVLGCEDAQVVRVCSAQGCNRCADAPECRAVNRASSTSVRGIGSFAPEAAPAFAEP